MGSVVAVPELYSTGWVVRRNRLCRAITAVHIQGLESDHIRPFWATEEAEGAGAEWVWEEWQEMDSGGEGGQNVQPSGPNSWGGMCFNTAEAKGGFYAGHPQGHSWCCVDGIGESKELSLRSKEFRSEDYLLQNLAGGLLRTQLPTCKEYRSLS